MTASTESNLVASLRQEIDALVDALESTVDSGPVTMRLDGHYAPFAPGDVVVMELLLHHGSVKKNEDGSYQWVLP